MQVHSTNHLSHTPSAFLVQNGQTSAKTLTTHLNEVPKSSKSVITEHGITTQPDKSVQTVQTLQG